MFFFFSLFSPVSFSHRFPPPPPPPLPLSLKKGQRYAEESGEQERTSTSVVASLLGAGYTLGNNAFQVKLKEKRCGGEGGEGRGEGEKKERKKPKKGGGRREEGGGEQERTSTSAVVSLLGAGCTLENNAFQG